MYLLDTNIVLEFLLDQKEADQIESLLLNIPQEHLYLSEFSFYSVGVVLLRRKLENIYLQFIDDLLISGGVSLVRLSPEDMENLASAAQRFNLDFDDAYQYVSAEKYNLTILSFDSDFDRTDKGRKTPAEVLK